MLYLFYILYCEISGLNQNIFFWYWSNNRFVADLVLRIKYIFYQKCLRRLPEFLMPKLIIIRKQINWYSPKNKWFILSYLLYLYFCYVQRMIKKLYFNECIQNKSSCFFCDIMKISILFFFRFRERKSNYLRWKEHLR